MRWATETKFRFQVFAILMTFICPILLLWQAAETRRQIASSGWPAVTGKVQGITARTWLDSENNTKYYGRVVYSYLVQGKEYSSELTGLGPRTKRLDRQEALADGDS